MTSPSMATKSATTSRPLRFCHLRSAARVPSTGTILTSAPIIRALNLSVGLGTAARTWIVVVDLRVTRSPMFAESERIRSPRRRILRSLIAQHRVIERERRNAETRLTPNHVPRHLLGAAEWPHHKPKRSPSYQQSETPAWPRAT